MNETDRPIQIVRPREVRQALGQWLRRARQRREWTQAMLGSRAGVPVATLSRLEREGAGGLESLTRILQALSELDGFHAYVHDQLRLASLPRDLSDLPRAARPRQRVRLRSAKKETP